MTDAQPAAVEYRDRLPWCAGPAPPLPQGRGSVTLAVMTAPADFARTVEESPRLPPGDCERVSGYGVMGLPFRSGHVLGLRRWTASSVGDRFTSIWHRDPQGSWTFYESVNCDVACSRYFGSDVERAQVVPIDVEWEDPWTLLPRQSSTSPTLQHGR